MEVYGYRSHSLPSYSFGNLVDKAKEFFRFAVSTVIGNVFSAIFTFFFALVGTLLGAMTGALIGQETESGFVRGAAVGAISGAVFSIEVFEASLVLWQSDESGIECLLYLIDVIASLLSGRLVRERIGPAMLSAVQSQMGAVEVSFEEIPNMFDTGGSKGLAGDRVEKIPKVKITNNNNVDASGEKASCSVCLQDFQLGETVRSLPHCHHMFHLPCIDEWLARPSLERGIVEEILDANLLLEPYNSEMMLKMGQLGLRCVVKVPKKRPTMTQVWQELEAAHLLSRQLHSQPTSSEIDQHISAVS